MVNIVKTPKRGRGAVALRGKTFISPQTGAVRQVPFPNCSAIRSSDKTTKHENRQIKLKGKDDLQPPFRVVHGKVRHM
jgi:hypothetical protein